MKLNNGAEIIEQAAYNNTRYVLARWDKGEKTAPEWVTWAVDDDMNAYWGHYFPTEEIARQDFLKRTHTREV